MNFYKVNIKIIFLCLLFSIQDSNSNPIKPIEKSIHALWDIQLKKYVSKNGKINYKSWANNIEEIYSYLKLVLFTSITLPSESSVSSSFIGLSYKTDFVIERCGDF